MDKICASCGYENPESAKFCNECGAKLDVSEKNQNNIFEEVNNDENIFISDVELTEIKDDESEEKSLKEKKRKNNFMILYQKNQ